MRKSDVRILYRPPVPEKVFRIGAAVVRRVSVALGGGIFARDMNVIEGRVKFGNS
jgi:hypothetical protein